MLLLTSSQRRLLNSLNPVFIIATLSLLMLIKQALIPVAPSWVPRWDILLPFIVFFGQRRSLPEGVILSLFCSHLFSLCSSAPMGVFTTVYLGIFVVARLVSYIVYAGTSLSILLLMIGLSALSRILLPLVAQFFHTAWPILSFENLNGWSILLNGFSGWVIYRALEALDRWTHKAPRMNIELSGDGL